MNFRIACCGERLRLQLKLAIARLQSNKIKSKASRIWSRHLPNIFTQIMLSISVQSGFLKCKVMHGDVLVYRSSASLYVLSCQACISVMIRAPCEPNHYDMAKRLNSSRTNYERLTAFRSLLYIYSTMLHCSSQPLYSLSPIPIYYSAIYTWICIPSVCRNS